jgi:hypothetical protein
MIGKLHEFVRHFNAVFHPVKADVQEIQFQVFIKCRFFFDHSGKFQHQFLPVKFQHKLLNVNKDLMTGVQELL